MSVFVKRFLVYLATAALGAILGLAIGIIQARGATGPEPTVKCDVKADIIEYYGFHVANVYRFGSEDTKKVTDFFTASLGPAPDGIDHMYVGLDSEGTGGFFFVGADGCGIAALMDFLASDVLDILTSQGIRPPFGSTFQGLPEANDGFTTGKSI